MSYAVPRIGQPFSQRSDGLYGGFAEDVGDGCAALCSGDGLFCGRDEGAGATLDSEYVFVGELIVDFEDGVLIDGELGSELANAGDFIAGLKYACRDLVLDLIDNLPIDWG